jgi:hypothetical protein
MPDRSEGRGQAKCSFWSSTLGVGHGADNPTLEESTVTKPWRKPRPTQGCSASKKEVVVLWANNDVLEEYSASVFRVKVCMLKKFIGRMEGSPSVSLTRVVEQGLDPDLGHLNL